MRESDETLLKQALLRVVKPFLNQGTETLFFSRNVSDDRYYVGAVPAMKENATGQPPTFQCQRSREAVSDEEDLSEVILALRHPTTETFPRMPPPRGIWISVVLRCQEHALYATLRSRDRIRTIRYDWKEKEMTIVPLSDWTEAVLAECKFQEDRPLALSPHEAFRAGKKR